MSKEHPSVDALAVAYLISIGQTQTEIAQLLGMSQAAVSRLFTQVRDTYVEQVFRWDKVERSLQAEVRARATPHMLGEKLKLVTAEQAHARPRIHVLPLSESKSIGTRFELFAAQAAPIVKELLLEARQHVGVAWGTTVWHLTQSLRAMAPQRPWRHRDPLTFVPLSGDPLMDPGLFDTYADRLSSRIAADLSNIVNGSAVRAPWLGLVPAFIPRHVPTEDIRAIMTFLNNIPQYGQIFEPLSFDDHQPPPTASRIADHLDMILTAAGPATRPVNFGKSPLLGLDAEETATLMEHIYGDIGGVLIPKLTNGTKDKHAEHPLVRDISKRWTGLRMRHLQSCAQRAFESSATNAKIPGVTMLSFGEDHADIVLAAIRQGLVNQLIIGSDLASALDKKLSMSSDVI
jgi:DNA-binding transcriptional regulator LsrR (DeoR family)